MNTAKHIIFVLSLLLCATVAAAAGPVTESGCDVYLRSQHKFVPDLGLHVLNGGDASAALQIPGVDPSDVTAVQCTRSSIVPQPGDGRVLKAGWPFYIAAIRPDGSKVVGVLEIVGGRYRLRLVEGQYRADESTAVVKALDALARATNAAARSSP
jgi:hypothetical protein